MARELRRVLSPSRILPWCSEVIRRSAPVETGVLCCLQSNLSLSLSVSSAEGPISHGAAWIFWLDAWLGLVGTQPRENRTPFLRPTTSAGSGWHRSSGAPSFLSFFQVCRSVKFLMLHLRDCDGRTRSGQPCPMPWCQPCTSLLHHLIQCPESEGCQVRRAACGASFRFFFSFVCVVVACKKCTF